jgi:signal transduction histidine kinase
MPETPDTNATVLYVDDLQTNLVLFQATFENDYNVILAKSVEEALEIMKTQEIQVLVTDQRMPDMSGTELLEIVAVEYPDIRRFLLTAFTDFETVVEAVNKGHIHGYINKPLKADEIRISINNSLEIYNLRKKNQQMVEELEVANRELVSLDGLKNEIIKVISLEIRNPLNRIMGTLHLLKDKIEGQELSEVINILDSSVSRLEEFSSMTEQIFILKSPDHELKISEVPLKRVLEYSLIEASEELKAGGIDLDLQLEAEDAIIMGESHLLVNCLVNLIRNGISHCSSGGKLRIKTMQSDNKIVCVVTDQGKDYSDQLFEDMESQFASPDSKLNLNLGIELGLAQMIMEAHGGKVLFEKTEDGRGSVIMSFAMAGESSGDRSQDSQEQNT